MSKSFKKGYATPRDPRPIRINVFMINENSEKFVFDLKIKLKNHSDEKWWDFI